MAGRPGADGLPGEKGEKGKDKIKNSLHLHCFRL